jgi:hypothetical protein
MLRFRSLAVVLVAAVLAALPVLRSACDLDCGDPTTAVPAAANLSSSASHCPQHPDDSARPKPAGNGDGCGHDHHAQRVTAARTIQLEAGVCFTPVPVMHVVTLNSQLTPSGAFVAAPPLIRPLAAIAPLRI